MRNKTLNSPSHSEAGIQALIFYILDGLDGC